MEGRKKVPFTDTATLKFRRFNGHAGKNSGDIIEWH
jgi:hypothetical protein